MKSIGSFVIPNVCKNSSVLTVVIFTELFALLLSLILNDEGFLASLGLISIYLQWIVLVAVGLLCLFKDYLNQKMTLVTMLGAFLCCLLPFAMTEFASQYIVNGLSLDKFDWLRFISFFIAATICTAMIMRLFAIFAVMEQRNKSEMAMRIQALQSRIKPHFLFNCLNSISELINSQPQQAEQAVNNLAMLFRASIETESKFHSLESELSLCHRYVELERWRLAERLSIEWQVDVAEQGAWQIPKLILQPLVENAIVHGVRDDGNIQIEVDIRETKNHISIMVQNSKPSTVMDDNVRKGHGIAVENIRERLFVLYDDQQSFRVSDGSETYKVIMRLPKQSQPVSQLI